MVMHSQSLFKVRWGLVLALAVASVGVGEISRPLSSTGEATWTVGTAAWAQGASFSQAEIVGYAASVLEMDGYRTEAYNQIQALLANTNHNINTIDMSCTSTASLNQLPRNLRGNIRTIVVNYCNEASAIVQSHGLTIRQFNAITAAHPEDPALAEQIRTALIQLQQQGNSRPRNGASQ
ncbi:DUF4168 domain-containing protein [Nodosilinea sp. P-1105]|nr:DUF4168 domain-containing protein [Nodosilinea sp. P-1105]